MDWRVGCAGDGFDGSDEFDRGLNQRGWVAVFDRGLLCRAWSARSGSCLVEEVFVVLGRRGLGFAYWSVRSGFYVLVGVGHGVGFFFFFFKYGFFFRWDFSGQWAVVAWWKRGGGDWVVEVV